MKIVADENIPLVEHYFGALGELILKSGRDIKPADVRTADILLVRSVTQVNQALLQHSAVKFVGSTTIGSDHLDVKWLENAGISWRVAAGCNATAVAEYVVCSVAALQQKGLLSASGRAGVIGVGTIGSLVVTYLQLLGYEVLQYDPLRPDFHSTPLEAFQDLAFITMHTPLTHTGPYPSYHMIEKNFLTRQKQNCILLNSGRGAAIDFSALKEAGRHLQWCLDVWENEPSIDISVLEKALIATPHIAGYSLQSKYRGIAMIYQAALELSVIPDNGISPLPYPTQQLVFDSKPNDWRDVVLKVFDPFQMTQRMKETLSTDAKGFDSLRKTAGERHEFGFSIVGNIQLTQKDQQIMTALNFQI